MWYSSAQYTTESTIYFLTIARSDATSLPHPEPLPPGLWKYSGTNKLKLKSEAEYV